MEISLETREFIRTHRDDDVRDLALHAKAGDDVDLTTVLEQIDGWQRARTKLPEWAAHDDIIYPPHLSMEQCSSQTTALYKTAVARRLAAQRLAAQRLTAERAGRDGKPNATNDTPDDETARTAATGTNTPTPDINTTDTVTTLIDLTGGFGVDFSYMARAFTRGVYVERQGALCEIARHNTAVLGLDDVTVVNTDATDYLMRMDADGTTPDATSDATPGATPHATNDPASTMIFIDPARRDAHGGRTYAIADCTPDVLALKDVLLERAAIVMVKLSPMLDWRKAVRDLGGSSTVREVHIVSTGNECKELLIVLGRADADDDDTGGDGTGHDGTGYDNADFDTNDDPRGSIRMYCVNDGDVVDYLVDDDLNDTIDDVDDDIDNTIAYADADTPRYVYEPNASIMKAGCFALIERRYDVRQIGPNSHLFVSELPVADFPGRGFAVGAMTGMGKRELKTALGGVTHANIATRNFPMTVAALRKKLRLKDGGDTYIFATTDARQRHVLLVTRKMPADQGGAETPHWS